MKNTAVKPAEPGKKEIVIHIDQEQFKVERSEMTVRELLALAGEEPAETTLVFRHGNEQRKYTNLDEVVRLENGMHFVVFHNSPTPVS
jgi:ABC-type uncharacterized transport system ATPase component